MNEVNLKKIFKTYYGAMSSPSIFHAGSGNFLTVTGRGAPESEAFAAAVGGLYSVAYTIRFAYKDKGIIFLVPPLEGFWWVYDDMCSNDFIQVPREEWNWKLCIRLPEVVTEKTFTDGRANAANKKKDNSLLKVRFDTIAQGDVASILHIGPYADESATIRILQDFIAASGYESYGLHHEIYLSDPRRTDPTKLKTVLMVEVRRIDRN